MNCRLDVQKYLNRQVKTVVNNLGSFDDSGFAYVTKDFNVNNLKEIKDLNDQFKFKFLEHKKSDNTDLPDYVQMNLPDKLVQHYINKYNKEQVVDNNQLQKDRVERSKSRLDNNQSDVQYQLPQDREQEEFVASEKTIRDLAARMSDRIGIPVRYISDRSQQFKGKLENGTAVVNLAYATLDTPIHEILGHPIIRAVRDKSKYFTVSKSGNSWIVVPKGKNYSAKMSEYKAFKTEKEANDYINNNPFADLYNNLLKELEYGKGKEVLDRIKRDYQYKEKEYRVKELYNKNYALTDKNLNIIKSGFESREEAFAFSDSIKEEYTLEEQQEEAIVELLGLYTAEKLDKVKDGKLISLLKRLLKEMKAFMKQLLGQKEVRIDKLPDNMTLGDIADLLAYSNSKLILPGNEVIYTTPDNQQFKTYQEASNHISDLAKNVEDVDLKNTNLIIDSKIVESKALENEYFDLYDSLYKSNKLTEKESEIYLDLKNNNTRFYGSAKDYDSLKFAVTETGNYYQLHPEDNSPSKITKDRFDKYIHQIGNPLGSFIEKNKEYEQSKEIIEEWKKVNNIQYNPEEVYSRGQEFVSVVGAYSDFDVNLMMQNLLQHIEDNQKAGGEFTISAFTKPVDRKIGHLEGGGGKIKFKIYPQSQDIKWAANTDVYSGSVWDASEKVSKDKKSELLGVSYSKYPSLRNVNEVQPNLANIIDDLAHHHNELGISLTGSNFRLEYDENIPYQTKKIINSINSILDQKYGKLVKPEIKKGNPNIDFYIKDKKTGKIISSSFGENQYKASQNAENLNRVEERKTGDSTKRYETIRKDTFGIRPTQTNETLKESIEDVKDRVYVNDSNYDLDLKRYEQAKQGIIPEHYSAYPEVNGKKIHVFALNTPTIKNEVGMWQNEEEYDLVKDYIVGETENVHGVKFWILSDKFKKEALQSFKKPVKSEKEYHEQALTNLKIAKLKEVAKKYPRSLIRSEVRPISSNYNLGFTKDELPFQKVSDNSFESFDLSKSDIVDNKVEELYPDSTILNNESLSDNNQFNNKNLLFGEQTSIKVDEVLKRLLDAEVFVKNEAVAFFWQKFMNLQGKSGATLKLIDKSHPSYKEFTENTVLLYDSVTNTIYATEESLQNYSKETIAEAFIHEVAHSTTVQAYFNPKTFEERQFRDFIDKSYEQYKNLATKRDLEGNLSYGFKNQAEFISEVYSNPQFRAELESIEKNWIQNFIDMIRRIIGLKKDLYNDGLIKSIVLFEIVDEFVEQDKSKWRGTLIHDPRYSKFGETLAKKSDRPKIETLDDKLTELINTQLNNLEQMRRRASAALKKGSKNSDVFVKRVQKVAEEVEKYADLDKLVSINNYSDFMVEQINHISEQLRKNPTKLEMLDTIERYRSYLGASDLLNPIITTLRDVRMKDLTEEQQLYAEEILNKLKRIAGEHTDILAKFNNYTVDNLRSELSKPAYNQQSVKDYELELLKNYPEGSKLSRKEWVRQEMLKPEHVKGLQDKIDRDISATLDVATQDISAWDKWIYSSLNTKSKLIQIVQKIIASAQTKITDLVRKNDLILDKLHKDLVKEKGKYDVSNLFDKDSDGKHYIKGEYSAEFRRLFIDEYSPLVDKMNEIRQRNGRNITKITKDPEFNEVSDKMKKFQENHLQKKGNKWVIHEKYKNNLKFSKAEQAIYDQYLKYVENSSKIFGVKNSLLKKTLNAEYYELPYRSISDVERVVKGRVNLKDTLRQKKSELLDWRLDDTDQYEKMYDSMGNELHNIPVMFRNNLKKHEDPKKYKQSLKEQSLDLLTLMRSEHQNQVNYQVKTENEITLNAIVSVTKEKEYVKTEPGTNNLVKNLFGNNKKYVTFKGESNEYKRLKSVVNQHLYSVFKEQGVKIGGKDINKLTQSINKHTAFLGMSLNFFQAPVNVMNAEFQNFLLKMSKDIDKNKLSKAHSEYIKDLPNILADTSRPVAMSKVNQLNLMMDIWGGFTESQNDFIKNNILKAYANTHTLQVLQQGGEHLAQSVLNIALLMSIKVMNDKGQYINKEGKVVPEKDAASIYDMVSLDKDTGELKIEGFEYTDKSSVTKWNEGGFENIKLYVKKKVFDTMGEYDKNYQNEFQRYWYGQLASMFKKYLIPLGIHRYRGGIGSIFKAKEDLTADDLHWNESLQEYEEGFYVTFGRFLVGGVFKDGLANSLNQLKWSIYRSKWDNLSDYEKGNIRKAISELGVLVLLNTVIVPFLMASAEGGDDDSLWYIALLGRRLQQELSQYLDISEAYKVTRNPIASLNVIEDMLQLVKFTGTPTAWFAQDSNDRFIASKIAEKLVIPSSLRIDKNSKDMLNYMNREAIRPYKETMFYKIFSEEN